MSEADWTCVVAEDEALLRQSLLDQLRQAWPRLRVVADCEDGASALEAVAEHKPGVAFLDIRMPGLSGLEVAAAAAEASPGTHIVFVTAYDQYAIDAFERGAVDYLLKPIEPERLAATVQRLQARGAQARFAELQHLIDSLQAASDDGGKEHAHEIWVRTHRGLTRVRVDDVHQVSAEGDYVSLHTSSHAYLHKATMASMESHLDPDVFARVHRSAIVNLSKVEGVRRRGPRALSLVLAGGGVVAVGPSFIAATLDALNARRWR